MTVVAVFADARRMIEAAHGARRRHCKVTDGFTPYPVDGFVELLEHRPSRIRVAMFAGGMAMAAISYGVEYYSAVIDYPYNSGGRPFHAWPTFMLVPFATGILLAAVCGLIAFLAETGLPRLHHPLFAVDGFERASQDRFMLALEAPATDAAKRDIVDWLRAAGALAVREVEA